MPLTEEQSKFLFDPLTVHLDRRTVNHLCRSACIYAIGRSTGASEALSKDLLLNGKRLTPETRQSVIDHAAKIKVLRNRNGFTAQLGHWDSAMKTLADINETVDDGLMEFTSRSASSFFIAAAWRGDAECLDDPTAPEFWENLFRSLPEGLIDDNWALNTRRDMLWDGLIPEGEDISGLQQAGIPFHRSDNRWLGFYRLLTGMGRRN